MSATHRVATGCLFVAIALGTATTMYGQVFGRGPARSEVRGAVKAVDAEARTITVTSFAGREAAATETTYPISAGAEIALSDSNNPRGVLTEGKLTDLAAGALVSLSLADDQQTVESIVAEGPTVRGVLKRVSAEPRKITLSVLQGRGERGEQAAEEYSYFVGAQADIAIDDGRGRRFSIAKGQLTDLAPGAIVSLRLSADQKEVQDILAEGPNLPGIVKSRDVTAGTVTLAAGAARGNEAGDERTLKLAADAVVLIDDGKGKRLSLHQAKLAEVPAGAVVSLKLSPDQQSVTLLRAEGPSLPALVKAVDAGKGTITVTKRADRGETPEERILSVASDARIVIDGNVKTLAELPTGDASQLVRLQFSLDQKTVQSIQTGSSGR